MKYINIPAQVTTVEDRIVGSLTLTQLSLLAAPIFIDFAFYAVLPKPMHINFYKLCLVVITSAAFATLAVRVKGKIILFWSLTLIRFKLRAKLYIFNKNSLYLRTNKEESLSPQTEIESSAVNRPKKISSPPNWQHNQVDLDALKLGLNFIEEKRGKLYVYVTESK